MMTTRSGGLFAPRLRPAGFQALEAGCRVAGQRILQGVNLEVNPGEVHVLLGGAGAGKSALLALAGGRLRADGGGLFFDHARYRPTSPADARAAGIGALWQRPGPGEAAAGNAQRPTAAATVALGGGGWFRFRGLEREAASFLKALGWGDFDPMAPLRELDAFARWRVGLARVLFGRPRLLLLDEPAWALPPGERDAFRELVGRLAYRRLAILYATRYLEEAVAVGHRASVMEGGRLVGVTVMTDQSPAVLAPYLRPPEVPGRGPRVLRRRRLLLTLHQRTPEAEPVTLTVHEGEVFGLAGMPGAGRRALLRRIAGLERGEEPRGCWRADRQVAVAGLPMLFAGRDVVENVTLPRLGDFTRLGFLSRERQRMAAWHWLSGVELRRAGPGDPVERLDPGQRLKLELARMFLCRSRLLLFYEPFAGLEGPMRLWLGGLIDAMARAGKGMLLAASSPGELLPLCDTIALLRDHRIAAVRPAAAWNARELLP